jgi:hypothetical protein
MLDAQVGRRVAHEIGLQRYEVARELQNGFRLNLLLEPTIIFVGRMYRSNLTLTLYEAQNRRALSATSHRT